MNSELNYSAAFDELQGIVSDIEKGEISIDELSIKVKRAAQLIKICKAKLVSTEGDVEKILKDLDTTSNEEIKEEDIPNTKEVNENADLPF